MIETILIILGALVAIIGGIMKATKLTGVKNPVEPPVERVKREVDKVTEAEIEEILEEKVKDVKKYDRSPDSLVFDANELIDRLRTGQSEE